ncbi:MAG: hypothetical protein O6942_01550 [Bacteroidetes bacterium]|nr:hypothetical protein [Bacteroidota bacterium]
MNLDSHWDKVLAEKENGGPESNDPGSKVTVNWRLLIISGIVVAGLFTTLAFWHHRQIKLHSAVLLSRALEAQDAEDWETAADWLSRYVRYVPDDVERVLDLASQVHEKARKREEFERALRLYRAYLEMRPEDDDVRAEIAKILLVFNPSQAVEHANRILASDPRHVNALRIRAVGMDRLFTTDGSNEGGKLVRVVQAYRRLLERSPDDVENAYRLATICWQYTDRLADGMSISPSHVTELADQVMDRLVKEKPNDVAARMTRFEYRLRFHSERGQPDDTKLDEDLRVVLDMEPGNGMALSAAGVHFAKSQPGDLIHVDRLEIARKFLRRAVSNQPNSDLP